MKNFSLSRAAFGALTATALAVVPAARASIAYGSLNNFDTVNDTGHECHGFEIEIEDCHSSDITYTYNYNHYGVPEISEDLSDPAHPRCFIRWTSKRNADGTWAAYTAVPSGPIDPTNGHQFTNPSVNFGGEHFGVGYRTPVGLVRYRWLIDDGSGSLISGGEVQVATPTFNYFPPAANAPARVQAAIQPPPEPPDVHPKEFGEPLWVKEIRTTSHNSRKVHLRDLVSDDPDDDNDVNWRNGEPDEIEVEWQLLQVEFSKVNGGANGELQAAPEDLDEGDEVVTRRYEFFDYVGPLDEETGEAMAENVGPDDLHGEGIKEINGVETDLSTVVIVGAFKGAQMAAVDPEGHLDLIDHVGEGEEGTSFAPRRLVIEGPHPFACSLDGELPEGMSFDPVTSELSGTPQTAGEFNFKITASDLISPDVEKNYLFRVAPAGADLPPASLLDTAASPPEGGSTSGDGAFDPGTPVTISATPAMGYRFVRWLDDGAEVSTQPQHSFILDVNHSLVAEFAVEPVVWRVTATASPAGAGSVSGAGFIGDGLQFSLTAEAAPGFVFTHWTEGGTTAANTPVYVSDATGARNLIANFQSSTGVTVALQNPTPDTGDLTGEGVYPDGSAIQVAAKARPGFVFLGWLENGQRVSEASALSFNAVQSRILIADFTQLPSLVMKHPDGSAPMVLEWPLPASGWVLEECDELNAAGWHPSQLAPVDDSEMRHVEIPHTGRAHFYRLRHP